MANININSENIVVENRYKYRPDGQPGRVVTLTFENELSGMVEVELDCDGIKEINNVVLQEPSSVLTVLLPGGVSVKQQSKVALKISNSGNIRQNTITVPALRYWNIFIYPHSHVDIGFTNTQANVEIIHTRNLVNGLALAERTKNYPDGAQYKWNPEVIWPVERYFSTASEQDKQAVLNGIREGYLLLDAGYVNIITSVAGDEELLEFFRQGKEYEKNTGKKIQTFVHVDIPGMTWGIVPVAAKLGIKYCFVFNNGFDRVGWSTDLSFKPFWWEDIHGRNRILFLQPGSYDPGAVIKGKDFWPLLAGQTDPTKLLEIVKTEHPRENFIDAYIDEKLPELEEADYYPYDIFPMSWAIADNTPIDADLPEAVKSWNEEYAYPRLRIAGATEIMREFDDKYGGQIPVKRGDFTEFWTDGAGTAARQTAMNRSSKERLVQAETLWTMLRTEEPAPRESFNHAWWNILMGSEHTWCYMRPDEEPINSDILNAKFAFFDNAHDLSSQLVKKSMSATTVDKGATIAVFNSLSWARSGIVSIPADKANGLNSVVDENGNIMQSQFLSTGELVFQCPEVPAFGSRKLSLKNSESSLSGKFAHGNVLDNGVIRVELNEVTGEISRFIYKNIDYVNQEADCAINSYRYLKGENAPDKASHPENAKIKIKENGPLVATISIETEAEGCHKLTSEITIYAGYEQIDIKNIVDKIETVGKEGVHFGFAFKVNKPKVVFEIPWGMVEIEKDQLPGANRNWLTLHRWLDISNDELGVTWCPLDAPVFQVGNISANILGAATESDKWLRTIEPSGTIYSWALNNHWHTNFQLSQGGEMIFRYRIKPHCYGHNYAEANRFAIEQYQPLIAAIADTSFEAGQLLTIEGNPAVYATVLKTSDDGRSALLRLTSLSDSDEIIRLRWHDRKPSAIHIYDLEDGSLIESIGERVVIPSKDFVTLKVDW